MSGRKQYCFVVYVHKLRKTTENLRISDPRTKIWTPTSQIRKRSDSVPSTHTLTGVESISEVGAPFVSPPMIGWSSKWKGLTSNHERWRRELVFYIPEFIYLENPKASISQKNYPHGVTIRDRPQNPYTVITPSRHVWNSRLTLNFIIVFWAMTPCNLASSYQLYLENVYERWVNVFLNGWHLLARLDGFTQLLM
jgi:hypothetical protein